ncbi:helix-turn-helix transcriptional regulator [Streptomyces anthocyanicus]|uniref:helix-turn-helix transcriptional regulator n=1 Tax=Streptomyces anthocyanicus TaxID=68174 RepID=UPI0036E50193
MGTTPHDSASQDELLTSRETAALTKYSPQTLANHRHLGIGIPYIKLPSGRIRYRRCAIEQWLAACTEQVTA